VKFTLYKIPKNGENTAKVVYEVNLTRRAFATTFDLTTVKDNFALVRYMIRVDDDPDVNDWDIDDIAERDLNPHIEHQTEIIDLSTCTASIVPNVYRHLTAFERNYINSVKWIMDTDMNSQFLVAEVVTWCEGVYSTLFVVFKGFQSPVFVKRVRTGNFKYTSKNGFFQLGENKSIFIQVLEGEKRNYHVHVYDFSNDRVKLYMKFDNIREKADDSFAYISLRSPFIFPSIFVKGGIDVPYCKLSWDGECITMTKSYFKMPLTPDGLGEMINITDTKIQWRILREKKYVGICHSNAPIEYDYLKWIPKCNKYTQFP